jgi:hypothetical protein
MPCTSRTNSTTRRRAYATRSSLGLRKSSAARWQNAARVESSAFGEEAIAEIEKGACELRVPAHAGGGRGNVRQGLWVSSRRASGRWKLRGVGSKRVIRGRLVEGIACDAGLWRSHPVRCGCRGASRYPTPRRPPSRSCLSVLRLAATARLTREVASGATRVSRPEDPRSTALVSLVSLPVGSSR